MKSLAKIYEYEYERGTRHRPNRIRRGRGALNGSVIDVLLYFRIDQTQDRTALRTTKDKGGEKTSVGRFHRLPHIRDLGQRPPKAASSLMGFSSGLGEWWTPMSWMTSRACLIRIPAEATLLGFEWCLTCMCCVVGSHHSMTSQENDEKSIQRDATSSRRRDVIFTSLAGGGEIVRLIRKGLIARSAGPRSREKRSRFSRLRGETYLNFFLSTQIHSADLQTLNAFGSFLLGDWPCHRGASLGRAGLYSGYCNSRTRESSLQGHPLYPRHPALLVE